MHFIWVFESACRALQRGHIHVPIISLNRRIFTQYGLLFILILAHPNRFPPRRQFLV